MLFFIKYKNHFGFKIKFKNKDFTVDISFKKNNFIKTFFLLNLEK